ncbi:MAG: YHS domain-containing protein, partial [Candidatus Binatia bacterium]
MRGVGTGPMQDATAGAARDPVCGMRVDPGTAATAVHDGTRYHFCSAGCAERFHAEPTRYLAPAPTLAPAPSSEALYTCPMHPAVRQRGPGACPLCGMALEPVSATMPEDDTELRDLTRRFWVGLAFTLPVVALGMGEMVGVHPRPGLQLVLATPVVVWGAAPFFARGWASIVRRHLNMFTLIAIGTGTAYAYSVLATVAPQVFPDAFRGHGGAVPVYFEAAAVITTLVLLGQVLELRARRRTGGAIRALLDLRPRTARRIAEDGERDVPLDIVQVGDRLRVRPG